MESLTKLAVCDFVHFIDNWGSLMTIIDRLELFMTVSSYNNNWVQTCAWPNFWGDWLNARRWVKRITHKTPIFALFYIKETFFPLLFLYKDIRAIENSNGLIFKFNEIDPRKHIFQIMIDRNEGNLLLHLKNIFFLMLGRKWILRLICHEIWTAKTDVWTWTTIELYVYSHFAAVVKLLISSLAVGIESCCNFKSYNGQKIVNPKRKSTRGYTYRTCLFFPLNIDNESSTNLM